MPGILQRMTETVQDNKMTETAEDSQMTETAAAAQADDDDDDDDDNDQTQIADDLPPGISYATWPDNSPSLHADRVITVVCGNSRLHWCVHEGYSQDFYPRVMWKSGLIQKWEPDKKSREEWMANFFPPKVFKLLFGTNQGPTQAEAVAMFATRKVSMCPAYVISTNDTGLPAVVELLETLPTRISMLRVQDFDLQAYDGIGVDRVANLRGGLHDRGSPVMIIDAGTALTWTCSEYERGGDRKVRGGGIAPGLAMKFRAMKTFTGKLPEITHEEMEKRVERCEQEKKPIKLFTKDTKDAMITSVLREFALLVSHIIRNWAKEALKGRNKSDGINIILTGGDSKILEKLLSNDRGHILQRDADALSIPSEASIFVENNVIHRGFASVLLSNTKSKRDMNNVDLGRTNCIGQRVIVDVDDSMMPLRGSLVHVVRGTTAKDDEFVVRCDDYSTLLMDGEKVCAALELYAEKGETEEVVSRIAVILNNAAASTACGSSFLPQETKKGRAKTAAEWIKALLEGKGYKPSEGDMTEENEIPPSKRKASSDPPTAPRNKKPRDDVEELPIDKNKMLEDPYAYLGRRVAKFFDDDLYFGKVKSYVHSKLDDDEEDTPLWRIVYDDGDKEEYDVDDMVEFVGLYKEKNKEQDEKSQEQDEEEDQNEKSQEQNEKSQEQNEEDENDKSQEQTEEDQNEKSQEQNEEEQNEKEPETE